MSSTHPKDIELLVLDVDGVLTDGRIVYDSQGHETKFFHVRDGSGIKYWQRMGRRLAIITGRTSEVTALRARELGIEVVRQGRINKLPALEEVLAEMQVAPEHAAYMGDDFPDLTAMRRCGLKITVAEAPEELRAEADWVSPVPGGHGAVRWATDRLLREAGLWNDLMQRYR